MAVCRLSVSFHTHLERHALSCQMLTSPLVPDASMNCVFCSTPVEFSHTDCCKSLTAQPRIIVRLRR